MNASTLRPSTGTNARRPRISRPVVIGSVAALALLVLTLLLPHGPQRLPLDPEQATSSGGRALAEVLRDHGTDVRLVRDPRELDAAPRSGTLLVTNASELGRDAAQALAARISGGGLERVVLLEPEDELLDALHLDVRAENADAYLDARCSTDLADPTDLLYGQGLTYRSDEPGAASCFTDEDRGMMVDVPPRDGAPRTVILGTTTAFTNATITRGSNAALALRLLQTSHGLTWYQPAVSEDDPPLSEQADRDGPRLPDWIGPSAFILLATALLFVLWQGRRFGPLVTEALPVVVPAGETTRARAQLYRRTGDTAAVGRLLAEAATTDIRRRLRLPADADIPQVAGAVQRVTGDDPAEVAALLTSPPAGGRDDLDTYARQLRELRRKVRSS